jgi:glycosyltransferase involved in cell wall biosynthesis
MHLISIIVPMRNEAATIASCVSSLLAQTISVSKYEIIIVDGMSDDNSAEIVTKLQSAAANLVLLKNPSRIMPAGMNLGLRNSSSPIVVVAGAHTSYPCDYLEKCLRYLDETGADVVGGPLVTMARNAGFVPRMIAAILSTRFGVGNAAFRTGLTEGWVDTVPYPAYRREVFERCGMYNERLVRAQDCELHARIRHNGGRIYQAVELKTYYRPVADFQTFWRKAFSDGKWQCFAVMINPQSLSVRRFVPTLMVLLLVGLGILSVFIPGASMLIAAVLLLYLLAGFYFGSAESRISGLLSWISFPFCAFPFHVCYGMGTFAGLWNALRAPAQTQSTSKMGPLHGETAAKPE